jgi:hypothetical protein
MTIWRKVVMAVCLLALAGCTETESAQPSPLRVGVAAVKLTPCGPNADYGGSITPSGVWGEAFTDTNGNGRWDNGEDFVDDPENTRLDPGSANKYDGIFLAGFGNDRIASGCHDDLWARALVLQTDTKTVALVSVDFVGVVSHGLYSGFAHAQALVDPTLGIDEMIFSSTHDHEAPDTLGLWGPTEVTDGKFPRYLQFVDRQIARAITMAAQQAGSQPATVVAATTDPATAPQLRGLQVRTRCRPPWFFDQELRALRFIGADGATIATLVNWSTHPESLEDENTEVSSDFVHYIRERVERDLGGTAVYFTGDLGAVEIVGDTCVPGADPHNDDGSNEFDDRENLGFARTQSLGELVGDATVAALQSGQALAVDNLDVAHVHYNVAGTNLAFQVGQVLGVLDPDLAVFDPANCPEGTIFCVPVDQYLLALNDVSGNPLVQVATAPGELFPELFYGTETFHRTDCPAANTGMPYEPSIRAGMTAPYRFLFGLSPDQFGYIPPGYDFYPPPGIFEEADDPCQGQNYDPTVPRRQVPSHYHETLSVGVDLTTAVTCHALQLLGRDQELAEHPACQQLLAAP